MTLPLFPKLTPRIVESLWFPTNDSKSDEVEIRKMEAERHSWQVEICSKYGNIIPIGKPAPKRAESEEEEEEEEDSNDDEESESQEEEEEEMEVDVSYEREDTTPNAESL